MKKYALLEQSSKTLIIVPKSVIEWLRMHDRTINSDGGEYFMVNAITYENLGKSKLTIV